MGIINIHLTKRSFSVCTWKDSGFLYEKVGVDDLDGVYSQAIIDVNLITDWTDLE